MRLPIAPLLLLATPTASLAQVHLEVLADLHDPPLQLLHVSDDGEVIAGHIGRFGFHKFPFRWSPVTGLIRLDQPAGAHRTQVADMSADGGVIVGQQFRIDALSGLEGPFPIRWDESGDVTELGHLGGRGWHDVVAVSDDGSTIAGHSTSPNGEIRAVRWVDGGPVELLPSPSGHVAGVHAVSADGSVILGLVRQVGAESNRVVRWTDALGMVDITPPVTVLGGMSHFSMSADGSAVLFMASTGPNFALIRWTETGGHRAISGPFGPDSTLRSLYFSTDGTAATWRETGGTPAFDRSFYWSMATDVVPIPGRPNNFGIAGDGSFVYGLAQNGAHDQPCLWNPFTGYEFLDAGVPGYGSARIATPDSSHIIGFTSQRLTRWNQRGEVGYTYCSPAIPNSTGQPGALVAAGTNVPAAGDVRLLGSSLPTHSSSFALASRTQGDTFPVSQSAGRLCLGGPIGRFLGPGQLQNTGQSGEFELLVPTDAIPTPNGPVAVQPGESWHFQVWHRDAHPVPTSNFTNGVSVTFF